MSMVPHVKPHDQHLLRLLLAGATDAEMGVSHHAIDARLHILKRMFGAKNKHHLAAIVSRMATEERMKKRG